MRKDRLTRLWPELAPRFRKIAKYLTIDSFIETEELISIAWIAVKKIKTTRKNPKNLTYILKRGNGSMKNYVRHKIAIERKEQDELSPYW